MLDLVAFNLMLAVQAACDVAAHVIADEGFRPASSLAESFHRLAPTSVTPARSRAGTTSPGVRSRGRADRSSAALSSPSLS